MRKALEEVVPGKQTTDMPKPDLKPGDRILDEAFAIATLPRRAFGSHKWGVGGVVIVAGGPGYVGAAALTAMSAGRAGAGVINVAVPRSAMSAVSTLVTEAAFIPLPERDLEASSQWVHEAICAKMAKSKAAVIGPGLGEDDYADALMGTMFGRRDARRGGLGFRRSTDPEQPAVADAGQALIGGDVPAVIDADGLNWLAKQGDWWTMMRPGSLVLTPHIGEMSRLTGDGHEQILADPAHAAKRAASKWGQIVVLKHGYTIATDGEHSLVSGDTAVSLATGGSGDVLAGAVGAFLAQGVRPLEAAGLALYIGLSAARRVEMRYGILGLVASDLPTAIAEEIASLERKRDGQDG